MKMWRFSLCLLTIVLTLAGCLPRSKPQTEDPAVLSRMVVSVDVSCDPEDEAYTRHYMEPDKVEAMIAYLRNLEASYVLPDHPENCHGHKYLITMNYASGNSSTYTQIASEYLQDAEGNWKHLNTDNPKLKDLLSSMESDL